MIKFTDFIKDFTEGKDLSRIKVVNALEWLLEGKK